MRIPGILTAALVLACKGSGSERTCVRERPETVIAPCGMPGLALDGSIICIPMPQTVAVCDRWVAVVDGGPR